MQLFKKSDRGARR